MIFSEIVENIRLHHSQCRFGILRLSVSLALLLFSELSNAQEFGGNPTSIDWRQINTDTVRVIFPAPLDSQAREIAGIVHRIAATSGQSLGGALRKIDIVLQNQPTISNGYVSLGPFRSEFFMTPRQNSFELGSLPWHKSLALHEYRHVQQYSNFRKGLSRTFYYVFGEEGQALANSLALPDWFWEGDALYHETKMSNQGRGRLPYFFNGYRSLWAAEKNYSWMKLRNGSYRDFIPDHYELGYVLVNYGYKKFGEHGWKKITDDAVRFKSLLYPFQRSFKRNTGQRFRNFREDAFKYFGKDSGELKVDDSASRFAAQQEHFVTDELYPQWAQDHKLVYLKSTYKHIPAFYIREISTGTAKKIRNKSLSTSDYFSYSNNKIVYSVYRPHIRRGWKNYENLAVIDVTRGKEKMITRNTRYQSPDISPDGNRIVAVHSGEDGTTQLHILDATTGKLIDEIPNPQNYVITYPRFFRHFEIVAPVRNGAGEMALASFNFKNGFVTLLAGFSMDVIAFPNVSGDTVYFSRSNGNYDAMYAYSDGKVLQFTPSIKNRSTGNYMLAGKNGMYAWSSFTASGFRVITGTGSFVNEAESINRFPINVPANSVNLLQGTKPIDLPAKKYGALTGLLNFHSWRPYFTDPEYSYSIVGNNILNTVQSELYVTYNRNERFKEAGAAIAYGGWYPVITGGASYTFDRSFTDSARRNTWNEFNARIGMNVPLNFVSGTFSQSLNAGASFNTKQVYYTGETKQFYNDKRFNYSDYFISIINQQLKARQNILPRLAQSLSVRYRHILNNYTANQFLVNGNIYVPGLFRNHNIVLQAAYQSRDTLNEYNFSNTFPFSRGYPDIDFPRMWKVGANYHFPIAYPDAGVANIAYLLRVRGNIFYDYSRVKSLRTGRQVKLSALGSELYFDTKWWNQLPVSFGIRYSRLLDADRLGIHANQWEIVLPTNILNR